MVALYTEIQPVARTLGGNVMDWHKFISDVLLSQIRSYTLLRRPWSTSGVEICEDLIEKILNTNREKLCTTFDHIDFYTHVYNNVSVRLQHKLTHDYGRPLGARKKVVCTCSKGQDSRLGNLSRLAFDVMFGHYEYRIVLARYNVLMDIHSMRRDLSKQLTIRYEKDEEVILETITLMTEQLSLKRRDSEDLQRKRKRQRIL